MIYEDRSLTTKTSKLFLFCIIFVICQVTLVISGELDDDSLEDALEAIERRQRDLQMRDSYGQPENIGYGFQKNLGFFEPGPSRHLGASREPNDWGFLSAARDPDAYFDEAPDKRERSNFRERAAKQTDGLEYLQALRNLWDKYQRTRPRSNDIEDLTDEEVAEMLSALEQEQDSEYINVPRMRRNYRVFEGYSEPSKRSPSFGQGLYGKRSSQRVGYETPPNDAFLYSLKWVNPAMNREGVEGLRGSDPWGEERDRDVLTMLSQPRYRNEEGWLPDAVPSEDLEYTNAMKRNYRPTERKRAPVKRNVSAAQKQATDEEVKGLFGSISKKATADESTKKTTIEKKKLTNTTKEAAKLSKTSAEPSQKRVIVRRAEPPYPGEITNLFKVQKKSIDWSKHFGVDKRMYANPFDTRVFNTKKNNMDNIKEVEDRIRNAEEKILADAVKYTGANSDGGIDTVRDRDIQYLEAAYKLEKMSSALEQLKNSMNEAETENPLQSTTAGKEIIEEDNEKNKRVAVKKEGVSGPEELEFLNWQRSSTPSAGGAECPLLDQLISNCLRMEELLGTFADLLVPACTLQQICYTCGPEFGFSQTASCDLMFLSEAQHLCQNKPECLSGATDVVGALRDVYERSPPVGTCRANPCVADHFLTSPSGVVSLSLP